MSDKTTELEQLRQQMAQVIRTNPAPASTREDRRIALFEDELREAGLRASVEIAFSELNPSLATMSFNREHGFSGADYSLLWQCTGEKGPWFLSVLNKKSGGKRRLLDCPSSMKVELLRYLDIFSTKIVKLLSPQD